MRFLLALAFTLPIVTSAAIAQDAKSGEPVHHALVQKKGGFYAV